MNPDKKAIVDQLIERVHNAPYMIVVNYAGMTMPQFSDVRKKLNGVGAKLHVTKNSYIRELGRAKSYPVEVEQFLTGQTAIIYGDNEMAPAGKIIKTFNKESKKGQIRAGVLDGAFLSAEEVQAIADLGSLSNVRSMLLGVIQGVPSALARVINLGKAGAGKTEEEPAAETAA